MATKTKKKEEVEQIEQQILAQTTESCIETDCVGFDLALTNGGGLPIGANILLFALPGAGKSTLTADVVYRLLVKHENAGLPFRVVYIDSENSLSLLNCIGKDVKNPSNLGLQKYISIVSADGEVDYKPQQLIYYPNLCSFKEAEEVYGKYLDDDKVKNHKDVKIIIVDSLTNLTSTTLMEAEVDKADFGSNAKERTRFYQKWCWKTRKKGVTAIYTSQMRQKQNATAYEDPYRAAVTKADEHQMDIIAKLSKCTDSKRVALKKVKQHTIDGVVEVQTRYILKMSTTKAAGTKNRFWRAVDVELLVKPGCKILNAFTIFNILEENNLYKRLDAKTYKVSDEIRALLSDIEFGEEIEKKELNSITSKNMGKIVEYLRKHNLYKATVGEIEEADDGLE